MMEMEARVLMPTELALICIGTKVHVCAQQNIDEGTIFYPDQGSIRLGSLPTYENDKQQLPILGGHNEVITDTNGRKVRKCNWVQFLSTDINEETGNVKMNIDKDGKLQYIIYKNILSRTPLILINKPEKKLNPSIINKQVLSIQDEPLDLSQKLIMERIADNKPSESPIPIHQTEINESKKQISLRIRGQHRSLLPCDVCGKAFDRPSLLKRHMRTHTGERPHACNVCEKRFSTSSSLNTHRRIHSGEKPHQCGVCGKRFTASSNLYYHRMTHTKDKPHKCELCLKSFPTPGDLRSHQYVHSGLWPYRCTACGRGFSKQTNLKNHLFLHTGDKPHSCNTCGKRFALACNLRAHIKTHEEENLSSSTLKKSQNNITTPDKINNINLSPWNFTTLPESGDLSKIAALWSNPVMQAGISVETFQRAGLMLEAQLFLGALQHHETLASSGNTRITNITG